MIEEFNLTSDHVTLDAVLVDLGIDSLSTIEFMFLLEEKFKLTMPGDPVVVKTVGDIAREIDTFLAANGGAGV